MVLFEEICKSRVDLVVDEVYEGGNSGNLSDEVISKLMNVQNAGGFRFRNLLNSENKAYIVLYTSNEDIDWMDILEPEMGKFKYYGDNKSPRYMIDSKRGNSILKDIFNEKDRNKIPPIFIFMKKSTITSNRSVKFLGLAVSEDYHLGRDNSLKAI